MQDSELERIRQEKLRALHAQNSGEEDSETQLAQEIDALEAMVRPRLSKEAMQRYANIKIAHPELSLQVLIILARAIESGQAGNGIIDDEAMKSLLQKMNSMASKEFKITRK